MENRNGRKGWKGNGESKGKVGRRWEVTPSSIPGSIPQYCAFCCHICASVPSYQKTTINDVNVVIYLSLCRAAKRAFRLVSAGVTKSDAITLI